MGEAARKPELLVTLSVDDLERMLRRIVQEELGQRAEGDKVFTRDEAAKFLGMHPDILIKYVRTQGLPGSKVGPEWRFRRSELLAWLDSKGINRGEHAEHWGAKLRAVKES